MNSGPLVGSNAYYNPHLCGDGGFSAGLLHGASRVLFGTNTSAMTQPRNRTSIDICIFRNWFTYPPSAGKYSTNKTSTAQEFDRTAREFILAKKRGMASTQPSIARYCEREFKAASRGTVGSLAMFYRVCKEGEQWQACTDGLFCLASKI